ncbi:MAG: prolyl oligopeptidase family serine peptidase [Pseudobacteriovorax sp.]|nr:prolyl oligopeptidase family serine peptidase [Pseudobacteriovorax sp.]
MRYLIDSKDRLVSLNEEWVAFATTNSGQGVAAESDVIGRRIWDFFSSEELKSVYRWIFQKVRKTEQPFSLPFRCDSPSMRRMMSLEVEHQGNGYLAITTRLDQSISRSPLSLLDVNASRTAESIDICSMCRRVNLGHNHWVEAEDIIHLPEISRTGRFPSFNERVCHDCSSQVEDLPYMVSLSGNVDKGEESPLIVFLHGETQGDNLFRLQAPPRLVSSHKLLDLPPFILLSVLKHKPGPWDIEKVMTALRETLDLYAIDRRRIYITGISSGGMAVWKLITQYPDVFAAAVPVAANANVYMSSPAAGIKPPVWATLGGADPVVREKTFLNGMKLLKLNRWDVKWTIFDGQNHDCWTATYLNQDIWEWLFAQKKANPASLI